MAAEFKIGRLRFTWAGTWEADKFYNRDAVVHYQGKTYVCLVPNTSDTDFYNDLNADPFPYWNLVIDGKTWTGPWETNKVYSLGNIALFGGKAYYCTVPHTSTTFASEAANWSEYTEFNNWNTAWEVDTAYGLNDVVKYGGIVYKCTANHTSAPTLALGLEDDLGSWTILNSGIEFKGVWSGSSVRYKKNDIVKNGPDLWLAISGHTSTSTFDQTKWGLWMPGFEFAGAWSNSTIYQIGDTVDYGGYTYVSNVANNTGNTPSIDSVNWSIFTQGYEFKGDWSSGQSYRIGEVIRRNGMLYEAVIDNTSQDPAAYSVSTAYAAAGSSGTTLIVANSAGITVGMNVIGTGFSAGQAVVRVEDSVTVIISAAPDGTLIDGETLSFVGVNYVNWSLVIPGTYWTKQWAANSLYSVGDIVVWKNGTYVCIQRHSANTISNPTCRPDQDTANDFWVYYIPHARKNALNTLGDIETYNNSAYTAISIGTNTFTLRVTNQLPTWSHINTIPKVYYVSTFNGQDLNTEGWGITWDKPWKTIAFACNTIGAGVQNAETVSLLRANKQWLITEMYQWMLYQKSQSTNGFTPASEFDETKTKRDAGYVIDALAYDIARGGNSQTVAATLAYFAYGSKSQLFNDAVALQINYFVQSLNFLSSLIINNVLINTLPAQNYQTITGYTPEVYQLTDIAPSQSIETITTITGLLSILTTALSTQSTEEVPVPNTGTTASIFVKTGTYSETLPLIVPANVAVIGDELRSVVVQPKVSITTSCTATTAVTNLFTVLNTAGMTDQMPVQFVDPNIATNITFTGFGGITPGRTYYVVGSSITSTQFSVAKSPTVTFDATVTGGSDVITNIASVIGLIAGASITGNGIAPNTTIVSVGTDSITISEVAINTTTETLTLTSIGETLSLSTYSGSTMTVYAGDCLNDMFRLRNGSGLRNMTFTGLLGTLGAQDANYIQRPTGGSYASLDPGLGPNDTSAWIYRRSPYVQNVTVFGNGSTGLKIDGNLHNGGNKSIVANDFTHILSDGIGVWCTGPSALTEVVSVFSYYGYTGYFAEAGGRIRATNGNTSYGTYGVIAEGFDPTEVPATGTIFNQSGQVQATVQQSYGTNSQLLRLDYTNAGSAYYNTTTNLLNYSNNFLGASWASDGNVAFSKVTIAPTGLTEAWTFSGNSAGPDGSYVYQNIAIPAAGAAYIGLGGINITGTGGTGLNTPATFDVTVTSTAYIVTVNNPGTGYATTNSLYIPGSQLGGINSVNDCTLTITGLSGSGIQQVSVSGTVPTGSNLNYTASVYVKQGTASSIDLYGIFSGSNQVISSINYNFNTGAITSSSSGSVSIGSTTLSAFTPTNYGAINQQLSTTSPTAGWYRLWFSVNDVTGQNTQLQFRIYPRGYNGTANQYTHFYGAQIEIAKPTYTPGFYLEVETTSKYTAYANYNITGAGTGAVTVADEIRSNSIFQTRIITDANGVTGGAGYLTASNNAQAGTTQFIQLAQADINTNGNYTGMRVFVNSGTGAGQYGYISYYNSSTKYAYVLKESFDSLQITNTTASTNLITLNSSYNTDTLYVNQPVQFIPTYYTTAVNSTSLAQATATAAVGGSTNTLTVSSTLGMYVNMPLTFSAGLGQALFSTVAVGYTYFIYAILDDTTIQITEQLYGNVWPLNAATGSMTINFPSNTSYLQGSTSNMVVNYPIQFTGTALGGLSVGTIYYVRDIIDANNFTISGNLVPITVTATNSSTNGLSASTASLVPLSPIVFSTPVFGNIVDGTKYYISSIIDSGTFTVASSLISVQATETAAVSNLITVTSTTGFVVNQPISFVGTSFGGIIAETTYYVLVKNGPTTFTISQTPGGGALSLIDATGSMTARTCPSPFLLSSASGTMAGVSTAQKTSLSLGIGTMNATFSTSLFGGVVLGTTYYVNTIDAGANKITVTATQGSGTPLTLSTKAGSMNLAAVGWDHINPGTPISANLDSSTVYFIEPRTIYSDPGFTQASTTAVALSVGSTWTNIAHGNGYWIAVPSANSTGAYSTNGTTWSSLALPSAQSWTGVAYGNGYWVIISSNGASTPVAAVSKSNGQGWKTTSLPSVGTWSHVTYGNGVFVAIATGTNKSAYSTNFGATWSAGTGLPSATWTGIAYGNGRFVAVASGGTTAAYSLNGITWISSTLPDTTTWSSIAYGNNLFVVVSSTSHTSAYSTDGITWYNSNLAIAANRIAYGQGVFVAVPSTGSTTAWTSEGGAGWKKRTVTDDAYGAICFGLTSSTYDGVFVTLASLSTGSVIHAGCKTKGRASVSSGTITNIVEWEPGSNYEVGTPPPVTFIDPNVTTLATVSPRISNGVLSSPTFINRGTGYNTSSTSVIITGDGYADTYQTGLTIILNNLTRLPQPGDNLTIDGVSQIFKVTNAYSVYNTVEPELQANVSLSPSVAVSEATANGTSVSIRSKYSQARLTNHDFLNIGYGNFEASNYPGFPDQGYASTPSNQVVEVNYGRVFYTSTDQDGNFKVGNLFGVQQATGIVTLSASQFGLTGLATLSLGGIAVGGSSVVITQFSTDGSFTANSDALLPTQRAIKSYLSSRLSQGGSNTFTGQLTAGTVVIGGPNYIRSTVPNGIIGSQVKMTSKVYVNGAGVDGNMAALDFFMRHSTRKN